MGGWELWEGDGGGMDLEGWGSWWVLVFEEIWGLGGWKLYIVDLVNEMI